jgi:acetyl-CoA carboxylase beta subunit
VDWVSTIAGGIGTLFTYLLFATNRDVEDAEEIDEENEVEINDLQTRHVTMSCQTCRKLKKHKEIKHNLFQCTKCKRQVDLRAS